VAVSWFPHVLQLIYFKVRLERAVVMSVLTAAHTVSLFLCYKYSGYQRSTEIRVYSSDKTLISMLSIKIEQISFWKKLERAENDAFIYYIFTTRWRQVTVKKKKKKMYLTLNLHSIDSFKYTDSSSNETRVFMGVSLNHTSKYI